MRRWQDHPPLHRLKRIYARDGLDLSRSTISGLHAELAALARRLVVAMRQDALRRAVPVHGWKTTLEGEACDRTNGRSVSCAHAQLEEAAARGAEPPLHAAIGVVDMHICLTCIELFGFGTIGGFGRATRAIGRELARRGHRVTVVVPRRQPHTPDSFTVDGMQVHQYPTSQPWRATALFRSCRADVFHSQDTSLGTYLAMKAVPDRPHLITFRDPMNMHDWRVEWRYAGRRWGGWLLYGLFVEFPAVRAAVRRAQGRYCAAGFLAEKAYAKYGLDEVPQFLPTPVAIPEVVEKAARPTVCHIGRWQKRKRPELFFELARRFPEVRFIAVGAEYDQARDADLRRRYSHLTNLEMTGVIDQFVEDRLDEILNESWILVNTAAREGLPITFVEAAAHGCAILSACDPDGFASRFGYHAPTLDFEAGLRVLLKEDRWRALGEQARRHAAGVFATERAIDRHIDVYRAAMEERNRRAGGEGRR